MGVPIIIPTTSTATGTTLPTIRNRLARTLGYHAVGVVTTLSDSLEAERYLISSSLQSDQSPPEHADGLYVWVRSEAGGAGTQRRVMNGSFEGAYGAAMVDTAYESGPLAEGTVFEVSVLPAESYLGVSGMHEQINEALEELSLYDYVPITITATNGVTDIQYSLNSYRWPIKSIDAIVYPRTLTASEARIEMSKSWDMTQDAESIGISFRGGPPGGVGDVFEVRLARPASTWVKHNGAWGDSSTGLVDEADETPYDAATVVEKARTIALERMALKYALGSKERMLLEGEADQARDRAALARFYEGFHGDRRQRARTTGGAGRAWGKDWRP